MGTDLESGSGYEQPRTRPRILVMSVVISIAMLLVVVWGVLTIAYKATSFVVNILLLGAIVLLAWWALRRVF